MESIYVKGYSAIERGGVPLQRLVAFRLNVWFECLHFPQGAPGARFMCDPQAIRRGCALAEGSADRAADLEQGDPHEELLGRTQRPCDKYSPRRARMPRGAERSLDRDV